jgi:isoleucyl-tRNA synthetase
MAEELKDTLNLPVTDFPMRAGLAEREPVRIAHWERLGLYDAIQARAAGKPAFVLHDGPPFTNGDVHIGTALNKLLKDSILRYKSMLGFRTPYVPGWDCHGLPIEHKVMKELQARKQSLDPLGVRKACAEFSAGFIEKQRGQFRRLGVLADWKSEYRTMDPAYEAEILGGFASFIEQGLVYRSKKPVYWSIPCETALAEAEIEYQDKRSFSIWVAFPVPEPAAKGLAPAHPLAVVIWTTTPWTLPANLAVAVHPELEYVEVRHAGRSYLVAADRRDAFVADCGLEGATDGFRVRGRALEGLGARHPFIDRASPVVLADYVTTDAGTGCVHTAPGHGLEDYVVGSRYGLKVDNPVGDDGRFYASVPLVGGMSIWQANPLILETLETSGNLLAHEKLTHSYPHCWRHKTPIIFRATRQWFIGMDSEGLESGVRGQGETLREQAMKAVDATQFFPNWGRARLEAMIRNRPDWCVSRQRNWGVPMPFFTHKESGELHPRTAELLEIVAKRVELAGIEAWFALDPAELLGEDAAHYDKTGHTLDVWFDSGVTHACVLKRRPELAHPADLYLEGSDQHRGWFQSSLLTGCATDGRAPYRALLTHGFVVDGKGHKMSKSKGNVIAPQKVMDQYGADILRLWVATTDYSGELTISDEILKRVVESYRRIRNTLKFLLANLSDFDPKAHALPLEDWLEIDRYALALTRKLQGELQAHYDAYEFHFIVQKLQAFCSEDLGGFYLDILKDRLYTSGADSRARRAAQNALYHITHALARWMAPILSFTGEEVWEQLAAPSPTLPRAAGEGANARPKPINDSSVFLHTWHVLPEQADQTDLRERWTRIRAVRAEVQKELEIVRVAGGIGSSLQAEVTLHANPDTQALLSPLGDDLRFVLITSQARVIPSEADRVEVTPSSAKKCERCWHYRDDVDYHPEHPGLCGRCVSNLYGDGEVRSHA